MESELGSRTKSGVFRYDDFRDNLIVDRYDPQLSAMRGSKQEALRSENSEDALTWNVFRSLRQIDPLIWFPVLFSRAFNQAAPDHVEDASVELWRRVSAPPSLRRLQGDEGESEVDVVIESDQFVWFIEAKYKSDISLRTTNSETRNQILRNIDVGSYHAGVRPFYFSLLLLDDRSSPIGSDLMKGYQAAPEAVATQFPHRKDALANLRGLGTLTWSDLAAALLSAAGQARRHGEAQRAAAAAEWLERKRIVAAG